MQHIVNLTQHEVTEDQYKDGVFDVDQFDKYLIRKYLTFDEIPTVEEMEERAFWMAKIAYKYSYLAMIGGAPYFMPYLIKELEKLGIEAVYSFTKRVSVDSIGESGEVVKKSVFKHIGFVPAGSSLP